MSTAHVTRCLISFLTLGTSVASADGLFPDPSGSDGVDDASTTGPACFDSLRSTGAIPLATDEGNRCPRDYPCLDAGIGFRNFSPDLADLSKVYGSAPSFELSPILCGMVELAYSDHISIVFDAGTSLIHFLDSALSSDSDSGSDSGSGPNGYQALGGVAYYLRPFWNPDLRSSISAGVALCSFRGDESGPLTNKRVLTTQAGATGLYVTVGLEYRKQYRAIEIYGGYCSYPEVSSDYTDNSGPWPRAASVSVDLSQVIVGFRLKGQI